MGQGERASGLAAAVEQIGVGEPPIERIEQVPLFPAAELAALPEERIARVTELRSRNSRAGRPNKRTTEWADYLLARYGSPLEGLAEICTRRALDLADELGCTPLEALKVQLQARDILSPYLHGKKPVEVQLTGALPVFVFGDPKAYVAHQAAEAGLSLADVELLDNQGVIEGEATRVAQPELHSEGKAQPDQGDSAPEPVIADHGEAGA